MSIIRFLNRRKLSGVISRPGVTPLLDSKTVVKCVYIHLACRSDRNGSTEEKFINYWEIHMDVIMCFLFSKLEGCGEE